MDEAISSLEETAPCIVAFGETRDHISDVKVVIERTNVLSMPTVMKALHFCFCSYYVFNISFPTAFKSILIFLEKYIYGLRSSQKLPLHIVLLNDGMERVL